jgi:CHASE2 domain-containing sensor protein
MKQALGSDAASRKSILLGAGIVIAIGLVAFSVPFSNRLSYDLPFRWRTPVDATEIVLVYMDADSAFQLHQDQNAVWNRNLHTKLLSRLTREKCRLVFYDIVFDEPNSDHATDNRFAEAIEANGKVILGAGVEVKPIGGQTEFDLIQPTETLRKVAS